MALALMDETGLGLKQDRIILAGKPAFCRVVIARLGSLAMHPPLLEHLHQVTVDTGGDQLKCEHGELRLGADRHRRRAIYS
jgi:hypothetical protein